MKGNTLLEIKGINSYYGKAQVIFDFNMTINEGEIVALLGRNGVGKTTLLKSIMGIEVSKEGKIFFNGIDITNMKTHKIASLGITYVPDYAGLIPGITVLENFQLSVNSKKINLQKALELYPPLKDLLYRRADALSGGEKKITAILRALLTNPKLMLLDEPTEGVMPIIARKIYELLEEMKREGIAILLVEQGARLSLAKQIATRISIMVNGRLVYDESPQKAEKDSELINKYLSV